MYRLKGAIQHYSWGGFEFIPGLINRENRGKQPFAEYWLGAHPNHPSQIEDDSVSSLPALIGMNADAVLGPRVSHRFGNLPYLLKVLDVRQMLSIQVHPDKASAVKGYELENEAGIPRNASHRNYKDDNHKPELMAALGDFWLLHGFMPEDAIVKSLQQVPELSFLVPVFTSKGYRGLYEKIILMEPSEINAVLQPLMARIVPLYEERKLEKSNPHFWAAQAALHFCSGSDYDRGIFSIYLFNLLHLKKGEGIYQPAGMPHAYLEGQNVEIMANSDNVLRAGLTDKHIDVAELMKHVRFEPTIPNIIEPANGFHRVFPSPAEEFELHQYVFQGGENESSKAATAEILLCLEGAADIHAGEKKLNLVKGDAVLITAGEDFRIHATTSATLFRVTVPGA